MQTRPGSDRLRKDGTDAIFPPYAPRRRSWAFSATITVEADIRSAPTAGESRIPHGARMPAASGIAKTL